MEEIKQYSIKDMAIIKGHYQSQIDRIIISNRQNNKIQLDLFDKRMKKNNDDLGSLSDAYGKLQDELKHIKNKWWFKLFNNF